MGTRDLLNSLAGAGLTVIADRGMLIVRPASKLTDPLREAVRNAKPEILRLLSETPLTKSTLVDRPPAPSRSKLQATQEQHTLSRELSLSKDDADRCHVGGWSDGEIATFVARRDRLLRWGRTEEEAEHLAERLTLRDRDADDRRCCAECSHLGDGGRCLADARGRLTNAGIDPIKLHRCHSFGLRKGLT